MIKYLKCPHCNVDCFQETFRDGILSPIYETMGSKQHECQVIDKLTYELKPCPFCGSENTRFGKYEPMEVGMSFPYYHVFCSCGASTANGNDKLDASKKWNKRV